MCFQQNNGQPKLFWGQVRCKCIFHSTPKMTKNRLLKRVFNLQTYMAAAPTFRMLKLMAITTRSELVGANHSGLRTQKLLLQKLEFKKESETNIILFAMYSDL